MLGWGGGGWGDGGVGVAIWLGVGGAWAGGQDGGLVGVVADGV